MTGDIYDRLAAAVPLARTLLARDGLASADGRDTATRGLVGHDAPDVVTGQERVLMAYIDASFVVGVAVGLLLDPALLPLPKGGAR